MMVYLESPVLDSYLTYPVALTILKNVQSFYTYQKNLTSNIL
jgi:hypothetical protein